MGCCGGKDEAQRANTRVKPVDGKAQSEYEDDLEGPLHDRGCTDILMLLAFIAALGAMGYVVYLSIDTGDPFRVIYGYDSYGNTCNRKNKEIANVSLSGMDMRQRGNVYYFNYFALINPTLFPISSTKLCVKSCPSETLADIADLQNFANTEDSYLCRYDIPVSSYNNGTVSGDYCPPLPIEEHDSLLYRCMPKSALSIGTSILGGATSVLNALDSKCQEAGDFFSRVVNDLSTTWQEQLYLLGISIGISFLVVVLFRFIAKIIIWTFYIGLILITLVGCGYCWYRWYQYKSNLDDIAEADRTDSDKKRVKTWETYAICASVAAGIILLILLVMRSRIALVVQLFVEASKAVMSMPFLLIQPLWTLIALLLFLGGLLICYLYIHTAGDPEVDSRGHVSFKADGSYTWWKLYYLFGVLWIIQFIFACHTMTIAGAVASWYFSRDKSKIRLPILSSIWRLIRYHLGTVAFGSLIIAIIQFCRIILAYIQKKLRGRAGAVVDFLLKCLQCCLWCLEKIMKFINKNAYIMTAIYGYSFCKAARKAFTLLVSNVLRVAAINSIGAFVLIIGKLGIVACVVVIAMEFFELSDENDKICYIWVPCLAAGLTALIIAHMFISVYDMIIDTIFLCFCEDSERNDGITKPYYMSKGLMSFVENSRKAMAAQKQREKEAKRRAEEEDEAQKNPKTAINTGQYAEAPDQNTLYPQLPDGN